MLPPPAPPDLHADVGTFAAVHRLDRLARQNCQKACSTWRTWARTDWMDGIRSAHFFSGSCENTMIRAFGLLAILQIMFFSAFVATTVRWAAQRRADAAAERDNDCYTLEMHSPASDDDYMVWDEMGTEYLIEERMTGVSEYCKNKLKAKLPAATVARRRLFGVNASNIVGPLLTIGRLPFGAVFRVVWGNCTTIDRLDGVLVRNGDKIALRYDNVTVLQPNQNCMCADGRVRTTDAEPRTQYFKYNERNSWEFSTAAQLRPEGLFCRRSHHHASRVLCNSTSSIVYTVSGGETLTLLSHTTPTIETVNIQNITYQRFSCAI